MSKYKPTRKKLKRCAMCKKRRVADGHHYYCNKCWRIKHLATK